MELKYPGKQPDEEPATPNQWAYIRSLVRAIGGTSIDVDPDLGKWQASALIDQLQDIRDSRRGRRAHEYDAEYEEIIEAEEDPETYADPLPFQIEEVQQDDVSYIPKRHQKESDPVREISEIIGVVLGIAAALFVGFVVIMAGLAWFVISTAVVIILAAGAWSTKK